MAKSVVSVSMDDDLLADLRREASETGSNFSAVVSERCSSPKAVLHDVQSVPDSSSRRGSRESKRDGNKAHKTPKSGRTAHPARSDSDGDVEQAPDDQAASGENLSAEGVPGASGEPGPVPAERSSRPEPEDDETRVYNEISAEHQRVSQIAGRLDLDLDRVAEIVEHLTLTEPVLLRLVDGEWRCWQEMPSREKGS